MIVPQWSNALNNYVKMLLRDCANVLLSDCATVVTTKTNHAPEQLHVVWFVNVITYGTH
jgi:hypothetical protein